MATETKDGLPVTEVTREQFDQMVADGERVTADPLAVNISVDAVIERLQGIIGSLTTQTTISNLRGELLHGKAAQALMQSASAHAAALQELEVKKKELATVKASLVAIEARIAEHPEATAREVIDGDVFGWAPLQIKGMMMFDEEAQP